MESCQQSYGLPSEFHGFSHGLKKCPPDTFCLACGKAALSNPFKSTKNRHPDGVEVFGGLEGIRTLDPHNANVVRSQLRYKPLYRNLNRLR